MLARAFVRFYQLVHGRLHLKGAGVVIRLAARWLAGLQSYPHEISGVGTIRLDFRDASACGMLNFCMGELDDNVFLFHLIERHLSPKAVMWDVGANIGWVSAYFSHPRFGLASIQAFEPNPAAFKALESLYSGHAVVSVHPFGLGSTDETRTMSIDPQATQIGSLRRTLPGDQTLRIELRRADHAVKALGLPLPDFIKIDVEGFETEVIAGMREIIASKHPVIIFEYQFLTDDELYGLIPEGYSMFLMLDDGTLTQDRSKRHLGHDAILLPHGRTGTLTGIQIV